MRADYAKRAKECGLKAGDFVRLVRKFVLEKASDAEAAQEEKKLFNTGDPVRIIGTWQPRGVLKLKSRPVCGK